MEDREAVALAAELAGAYPGRGVSAVTVSEWTREIVSEDREVAVLAIGDLVQTFTDRAPSLGQLREALRIRRPQLELPAHEDLGYTKPTTGKDVDHWRHGRYHLAELLSVPAAERTDDMREIARYPDRCSCDNRAATKDPADIVRELSERYG